MRIKAVRLDISAYANAHDISEGLYPHEGWVCVDALWLKIPVDPPRALKLTAVGYFNPTSGVDALVRDIGSSVLSSWEVAQLTEPRFTKSS